MSTLPDTRAATVVYVDSDLHGRVAARETLGEDRVLSMGEGHRALAAARLYRPDVIIVAKLADMTPERFVELVRSERHLARTPIVILAEAGSDLERRLSEMATFTVMPASGTELRQLVSLLAAPRRA